MNWKVKKLNQHQQALGKHSRNLRGHACAKVFFKIDINKDIEIIRKSVTYIIRFIYLNTIKISKLVNIVLMVLITK